MDDVEPHNGNTNYGRDCARAEGCWDLLLQHHEQVNPSCGGQSQREVETLRMVFQSPRCVQDLVPGRLWTPRAGRGGGNSSSKDVGGHVYHHKLILWVT